MGKTKFVAWDDETGVCAFGRTRREAALLAGRRFIDVERQRGVSKFRWPKLQYRECTETAAEVLRVFLNRKVSGFCVDMPEGMSKALDAGTLFLRRPDGVLGLAEGYSAADVRRVECRP